MQEQKTSPVTYPIQPTYIAVRELHFISHRPPSPNDRIDQGRIRISQSVGSFNETTKRVQVSLSAELGFETDTPEPKPPFSVKVVITGEFAIDDTFPREKIKLWASVNAMFVIYPYLRERLYYVTSQGGYPPILLPLMQIPTMKIGPAAPVPESTKT